ncbi:MAG: exopolysaccharide Pel transporter PelG [Pseudomonadota bacterium]
MTAPMLGGLCVLLVIWTALRYVHGPRFQIDLHFIAVLSLLAVLLGYVLALCAALDNDAKRGVEDSGHSLDITTWAPAVFTLIMLTDRFLLSNSDTVSGSLLHSIAPALISVLCTVPALWFFLRYLEPELGSKRRELLNAVYEGESLLHIEQLLTSFINATQVGLMTFAKLLGVTAIATILIGPELLFGLGLDASALGRLQLAVISSAMLAQFLACVSLYWLLQLRGHALLVTLFGLLIYIVLAIASLQSDAINTAIAAALAASVTSIVSLSILRHSLDELEVDLLLH